MEERPYSHDEVEAEEVKKLAQGQVLKVEVKVKHSGSRAIHLTTTALSRSWKRLCKCHWGASDAVGLVGGMWCNWRRAAGVAGGEGSSGPKVREGFPKEMIMELRTLGVTRSWRVAQEALWTALSQL